MFEIINNFGFEHLAQHWLGLIAIMSQARPNRPGSTYLVTRRVERRASLLRPDPVISRFIEYAFVVAALRHGILVHAFCAMSTHLHYVVTDPHGHLPRFLAMFHRAVAKGVQIIRNRDGGVWNRSQPSVVELCTRQAIVEKIAYTLANPVQAGLVRHAIEWPGAKTNVDDFGMNSMRATRPAQGFSRANAEWTSQAEVPVSLPPTISQIDAESFRADVATELRKLEDAAHALIPAHKVLGAKRAATVDPENRATSHEPKGQRNPTFAVGRGQVEAFIKARKAIREFRGKYRRALEVWRAGDRTVEFPAGTYAMRVFHRANVAT